MWFEVISTKKVLSSTFSILKYYVKNVSVKALGSIISLYYLQMELQQEKNIPDIS